MKRLNWIIIAMVAMFVSVLPMGCGDYEHQLKKFHESCTVGVDTCEGDLVCGNEQVLKNVCTTFDMGRCNNGIHDGDNAGNESDTDCGWSCRMIEPPNLCSAGKMCNFNADCDGTKNLVCNDGICGEMNTNQCSAAHPCPTGQNCVSGACIPSSVCTPACTTGYVCINNACQASSFQDKLCATPTVACNVTCWSQFSPGVMDINAQYVAANQQLCCPTSSGSFTLPNGTPGSYTGWHGETTARPFESFNGAYGGFK